MEARSMLIGAVAFFFYAGFVSWLLIRRKLPVFSVTTLSISLWFICAFGLWYGVLRLAS